MHRSVNTIDIPAIMTMTFTEDHYEEGTVTSL